MPGLVLSRRFSDDANSMWRAAVAAGWDVVRATSYAVPAELQGRTDIVFYAETLLAAAFAPSLGVGLLEPDARWLAELPERYVRRAIRASTVAGIRTRSERAFVKPADEKVFPARVYEASESIDPEHAIDDSIPTLISEPVRFETEVRSFVLDRRVITYSAYMRDGDIAKAEDGSWPLAREEEEGALKLLAEICADEVPLPPGVVIDVGRIEGRGWAVVEANAAWASGVCGCDAAEVLRVVERTTVPSARLADIDRRWLRTPSLAIG
jgi:hypothetical protein